MNILDNLKDFKTGTDDLKYYDYNYIDIDYISVKNKIRNKVLSIDLLNEQLIPYFNSTRLALINPPSITELRKSSKLKLKKEGNIYFKMESDNPTGSYKDRETWIVSQYVTINNINSISIVSSGNAAISASYYSELLNINCYCYVPTSTTKSKVDLLKKYKAKIKYFDGDYATGYRLLADSDSNDEVLNITSGQFSPRTEGGKSIAYEIFLQMSDKIPDIVVVPIGNGSCFSAIWKGFYDLKELKLIRSIPQIVGVVHETCNVLSMCLKNKSLIHKFDSKYPYSYYAEGIVGAESFCIPKVLDIVQRGDGVVYEVNDREIANAVEDLKSKEGINIEPTSASVLACVKKYFGNSDKNIVLILTGRMYK